jgi:hypothetical protein
MSNADDPVHEGDDADPTRTPVVDLQRKLAHLAQVFGHDPDEFTARVYGQFSHGAVDKLRAGKTVNKATRAKLADYLTIQLHHKFMRKWLTLPFDKFVDRLAKTRTKANTTMSFDLADSLGEFSKVELADLPGTYLIYRNSFSNREQIAREWLTITLDKVLTTRMNCHMWCHPSGRKLPANKNVEDFNGALFKFDNTYYLIASLKDPERKEDARMRFLLFPFDNIDADGIHYGIAAGRSLHLQSPVAARVVLHRVNETPSVMPDLGYVDRIAKDAIATSDDALLQKYAPLIDNQLASNETVLTATLQAKRNKLAP